MFRSSDPDLRCSRAREWVSYALDGELGEAERARLATHLVDCEDCRRHEAVLERGRAALQATLVEPSENFEWKVQLGIQKALREGAARPVRPSVFAWGPALASAAAVALLVVGAGSAWLLRDPGTTSTVSPLAGMPSVLADRGARADVAPAEPDLSGGVRGEAFEIDATGEGFGIRTVSRTVTDPRFRGDLYAPVRDRGAWSAFPTRGASEGSTAMPGSIGWAASGGQTTWHVGATGVGGLNLRLRGYTLPPAREQGAATAESLATQSAPR